MAKVLLLGGTGAIGVYLRRELAQLGHDVVVTSRRARDAEDGVRYLVGDGKNLDFVKKVLSDETPDVIVDFMIYSTDEFAERVETLLANVRQYIFLSSYRVFNEQLPLRETSPRLLDSIADADYLKTDEYGLCKARCENILRASGKKNWTIVRPCITYSKERFQFGCLEANVVCYRSFHGQDVVIPEEMLHKRTTMSWAGDVSKMIARLVLTERALGDDFNVVTSESHTWAEVAEIYREALGMSVRVVPLAKYLRFCGSYQVRYDRLFDRVMDNSKILSITGLSQSDFLPLAEGLKRELTANRATLLSLRSNLIQNARIDAACRVVCLPGGGFHEKLRYLAARFAIIGLALRILSRLRRILVK